MGVTRVRAAIGAASLVLLLAGSLLACPAGPNCQGSKPGCPLAATATSTPAPVTPPAAKCPMPNCCRECPMDPATCPILKQGGACPMDPAACPILKQGGACPKMAAPAAKKRPAAAPPKKAARRLRSAL